MVDRVQAPVQTGTAQASGTQSAEQAKPVPPDQVDRFKKAMIAAALRQPMINLKDDGPDDDRDPDPLPMKAPIITVAPKS